MLLGVSLQVRKLTKAELSQTTSAKDIDETVAKVCMQRTSWKRLSTRNQVDSFLIRQLGAFGATFRSHDA